MHSGEGCLPRDTQRVSFDQFWQCSWRPLYNHTPVFQEVSDSGVLDVSVQQQRAGRQNGKKKKGYGAPSDTVPHLNYHWRFLSVSISTGRLGCIYENTMVSEASRLVRKCATCILFFPPSPISHTQHTLFGAMYPCAVLSLGGSWAPMLPSWALHVARFPTTPEHAHVC